MAAIVMAGVIGVLVGLAAGMWIERGGHRAAEGLMVRQLHDAERKVVELEEMAQTAMSAPEHKPLLSDELTARLIERLMDASLPVRDEPRDEERPGSPGEYEPPPQEINDWTDPFIGLERQMVGGLAPGQGIPGIGQDGGPYADHDPMTDQEQQEWRAALDDSPEARGFEAIGEELFDQWEDSR